MVPPAWFSVSSVGCALVSLLITPAAAEPAVGVLPEESFLIRTICGEMLQIAEYARSARTKSAYVEPEVTGAPKGAKGYRIEWKGGPAGEPLSDPLVQSKFFFSPRIFSMWLRPRVSEGQPDAARPALKAAPSETVGEVVASLLRPTAEVLEKENQRISQWLTREPENGDAHDEAALLVAAFALREASGNYEDTRPALCRLTAHLAMAEVWRGTNKHSPAGKVAELAMRALCCRQAELDTFLPALAPPAGSPLAAWSRAISLRSKGDWRILEMNRQASLLERISYVHALLDHTTNSRAFDFLLGTEAEDIPDWARLCLSHGFSVEQGHRLTRGALALELREIQTIGGAFRNAAELKAFLSAPPAGPVATTSDGRRQVRVLDAGLWGRFAQRHLLHVISTTDYFLRRLYGEPKSAKEHREKTAALVDGLVLSPPLQVTRAQTQEEYDRAMQAVAKLMTEHPEWISPVHWVTLRQEQPPFTYPPGGMPDYGKFFLPTTPTGAILQPRARLQLRWMKTTVATLENWNKLAPYESEIARYLANAKKSDAAEVEQYYAPFADYDLTGLAGRAWMVRDDPAKYLKAQEPVCAMKPDKYLELGLYLVEHEMPEEAAKMYQKGVDLAPDRVAMANKCRWLVNYYFDKGEKEKALTIAREAAEVYSQAGLETMALLLEKTGDLIGAEEHHQKIAERYSNRGSLVAFYFRHAKDAAKSKLQKRAADELRRLFPEGMLEVSEQAFSGKPTDGVIIKSSSNSLRAAGIFPGAIIVALDGRRTRNLEQYTVIRALSDVPSLNLIVHQDGRYQRKAVSVSPERLFFADIATYMPE